MPERRWEAFLATASCAPDAPRSARRSCSSDTEAALKLRALEAYRTQFENLNAGPLDRLRHPEIIGFELRWELRVSPRLTRRPNREPHGSDGRPGPSRR